MDNPILKGTEFPPELDKYSENACPRCQASVGERCVENPGVWVHFERMDLYVTKIAVPTFHQISSEEIQLMRIRLAKITTLHNQLSDALIKATMALVDLNRQLDEIEHPTLEKEYDA